jgi:hypothetical protein
MPIRFFKPMIEVADVQVLPDEGILSPDMNPKGGRVETAEAARKGEVKSSGETSIIYEEI